jgi:hypothetical protein
VVFLASKERQFSVDYRFIHILIVLNNFDGKLLHSKCPSLWKQMSLALQKIVPFEIEKSPNLQISPSLFQNLMKI